MPLAYYWSPSGYEDTYPTVQAVVDQALADGADVRPYHDLIWLVADRPGKEARWCYTTQEAALADPTHVIDSDGTERLVSDVHEYPLANAFVFGFLVLADEVLTPGSPQNRVLVWAKKWGSELS